MAVLRRLHPVTCDFFVNFYTHFMARNYLKMRLENHHFPLASNKLLNSYHGTKIFFQKFMPLGFAILHLVKFWFPAISLIGAEVTKMRFTYNTCLDCF